MKILIIINILLILITGNIYLSLDSKIKEASTQSIQAEFIAQEENIVKLIETTKDTAEQLNTVSKKTNFIVSNIGSIEEKLKESNSYISIDSGIFLLDKDRNPDLISDGSCDKKRGVFNNRVNFNSTFKSSPKIVLTLSGLDIWSSKDSRFKTEITNVDSSGFNFNAYTWCDTSVSYAKLSWIAIGI